MQHIMHGTDLTTGDRIHQFPLISVYYYWLVVDIDKYWLSHLFEMLIKLDLWPLLLTWFNFNPSMDK